MDVDEPLLLDLAAAVLDGQATDWTSLESSASNSQRAAFEQLQALAAIGSLSRHRPKLPVAPPELLPLESTSWGQLRILERIGRGGFGSVYRAWDPQLDREVALKLLPANEDGVNALEEGRLLARVHHPNVVTIFGADRIGPFVGLWMEYVRGDTLEHLLNRDGPLSSSRVADIGRQLCAAVTAVHHAGLVHRDVKAQNVMLEPGGRLVLMDFGAGRSLSGGIEDIAGTPLYLAPEIFSGARATARSDIYSVGVVLFHLLTNRYPVEGTTLREVRAAHGRRAVDTVRLLRRKVPRRLASVIERALSVRPEGRFESSEEMSAALTADVPGRPRTARRLAAGLAMVTVLWLFAAAIGIIPALSNAVRPPGSPPVAAGVPSGTPTARRLSLPGATFVDRGLSADGRFFSFLNDDGLAVFDMSTGESDTLVPVQGEEFAEFSIMSPDGGQIAYQWWTAGNICEIRVIDRLTRQVRRLLRDETLDGPMPIEWTRDRSSILLWLKTQDGSGRIAFADAATGAVHTVRAIAAGEPLGMSVTPDGRYIAYDLPATEQSGPRTLHVIDRAGKRDQIIPADVNANDRFPLWTPNGDGLFFLSDRSGSTDGWLIPVQDGIAIGEPALAIRNLSRVSSLGLTDGGMFYYRLQAGAFEINAVSLDPNTMALRDKPARVSTRFAGSNIGPSYSRDGRFLSYISVRDALGGRPARTLVIKDLISGEDRELIPPSGLGNAPARWSPDGTRLLVGSRIIDAWTGLDLHLFNQRPAKDQTDFGPVRWESNQRVIYERAGKGLFRHSLTGGPDALLYSYSPLNPIQRIHRFEIAPNGSSIAVSAFLKDKVGTVLEVITGGHSIELARRTEPEGLVVQGWSPDGQFVLFTTFRMTGKPPHEVWRIPASGGTPERLGTINGATQINPVALSPSGTALAFTSGTPLNELWTLRDFLPR